MSHSENIADQAEKAVGQFHDWAMASHRRRRIAESALPVNWSGLCHECDEHIAPDRLEANPRVFRCFDCQTTLERRETQR